MASNRKIIAEFVGVFLIGAAAGGLLTYSFSDNQISSVMSHWNNADTLEARIDAKYINDYQLTPEEMTKIKPLVHQLAHDLYTLRHQFGVDVIDIMSRDHDAIAAQMTPEHRAAYEKKVAERTDQLRTLLLGDQGSPAPASP
jgi:hypothetical protein